MTQLLFKGTLDFSKARVKDAPLLLVPQLLIVGIEDESEAEIMDTAYLIQYPFIDGFGFVKGAYFKLSSNYTLLAFDVQVRSKFRFLPLRKQQQLTVSIWKPPLMPLTPDTNPTSSTGGTTTSIAASVTSVSLLPANNNRKSLTIYNNSIATLYVGFGATVSATNFAVKIGTNTLWEMPTDYDGPVVGLWSAANGNALVTEFV